MRWLVVAVVALVGCGDTPPSQSPARPVWPPVPVKHPEMLAMMERYLASPLSDGPPLDQIRDFVMQSRDVRVVTDDLATPFVAEDLDDSVKNLLMMGFFAGNAASQLRRGVPGDDLIAGIEGELRIYLAMKSRATTTLKSAKVVSPSLDALLELQGKGELRAHLERMRVRDRRRFDQSRRQFDDEMVTLLRDGAQALRSGRAREAITDYFDRVIASHQQRYAGDPRRVYCAHDVAESMLYMTHARNDAVALKPTWADAWFLKSYALAELRRDAEAVSALDEALGLSPSYSQYLSERAYHHARAKDWQRSLDMYRAAEDAVKLMSDAVAQRTARTRALRGQGHALIELGDLDAAEAKYRASLALEPGDKTSKQELEYIRGLRARP